MNDEIAFTQRHSRVVADFSGMTIIVTGSSSGIGEAIVDKFLAAGAIVCGCDISPSSRVVERYFHFAGVDVSDEASMSVFVNKVIGAHGGIDVLVNSAGVGVQSGTFVPTHEVGLEEWQKVINVNLTGTFIASKFALPHLLESKGSIVNIASVMAHVSSPGTAAYTASKSALLGLTRVMALEYAAAGVRVNAICPGYVSTPMVQRHLMQSGNPEAELDALAALHPVGRIADASEVADAVVWVASGSASFVTGAAITVDGGYAAR
jgi:dihydroanticapsin dehydrogenase